MIKTKLIAALNKLRIDTSDLKDDTALHAELGMDSQEIIELHCCLEKLFGLPLPEKFIADSETIGSLVNKLANLNIKLAG